MALEEGEVTPTQQNIQEEKKEKIISEDKKDDIIILLRSILDKLDLIHRSLAFDNHYEEFPETENIYDVMKTIEYNTRKH